MKWGLQRYFESKDTLPSWYVLCRQFVNISGQQHTRNLYIERDLCLWWNCYMGHGIHCKVNPSSWKAWIILSPYFQGSWPTLIWVAWGAKTKRERGKNATVVYIMINIKKNSIGIFFASSFRYIRKPRLSNEVFSTVLALVNMREVTRTSIRKLESLDDRLPRASGDSSERHCDELLPAPVLLAHHSVAPRVQPRHVADLGGNPLYHPS